MNRPKLLILLLLAIALFIAAILYWNPEGDSMADPSYGENAEQADESLDQAIAEGGNGTATDEDGNGGRTASPTDSTSMGPAAQAAAVGGSYQIRALTGAGAAASNARFLIENSRGAIEWIDAPSGVLNMPNFETIHQVAALAGGMWSAAKDLTEFDGSTADLDLNIQAATLDVEVNRVGSGPEPEFDFYFNFRDRPQDLGETIAAVFQGNEPNAPPSDEYEPDLFHKAFRCDSPSDPRSRGRAGAAQLRDLPPGFYSIRAQSTWGVLDTETLELAAGEHQNLLLELVTGGWLSGRVLGPDGQPLADATVMFRASENNLVDTFSQRRVRRVLAYSYNAEPRADLAHTNQDGEFSMGPVAAGTGIVAAGKKDLLPAIVGDVIIDGGQEQSLEDIKLQGGHTVALLVTDATNGEVLTHSTAEWHVTGNEIGLLALSDWESADMSDRDQQGRLLLRNLPFERLGIRVHAEGFAHKETEYLMPVENWESAGDPPVLEIALHPGLRIRGSVIDGITGEPVEGADVVALNSDQQGVLPALAQNFGGSQFPTVQSAADGTFSFADLPAGDYMVQVQHADYAPLRSELIELAIGIVPEVNLLLRPGATLIAHYLGEDGNSEANRSIILVHLEIGSTQTQSTNQEGMAYFKGLPAGNMQIATLPGDANPEEVGQGNLDLNFVFVELAEGETRIVELGPGLAQCKVQGMVTRGGAGVDGKSVTLLGTSGMKSTKSSDDGSFEFDGLSAGEYSYLVGEQSAPAFVGTVSVGLGTNSLEIQLPDGGIKATVLNASDRSPIPGLTVTVTANNTRGGPLFAMTNAKGEVNFPDLEAGLYQINAGKASLPILGGDDAIGSKIVDVNVDNELAEIEVLLEAGATFRARVLGTDGTPVSGANLYYLRSDGTPLSQLSVKGTNSKGVAQLTGLPSGSGRIVVRHPEHGQAEISVSLTAGELSKQEIKLQTGCKVYIQVTDQSDRNLPGILAVLDDSRGARTSWLFSMSESQDYNAAYFSGQEQLFGPLPAGEYSLKLFRLGGKVVEYKITIPPDTPELRLRYAYNP